ncbi:HDIG domain-containing protein [Candidatus Bipolaricaulota bacterium]|nr:HDIG domain-containing protein [Candidatus Bipolaricaulota bacterium]
MTMPDRQQAYELLVEYNKSESLIKHALAVEAVMRAMARKLGEDEEMWGAIGLIHDLDYDQYPQQHCQMTEKILRDRHWPEDAIHAVLSHGWKLCTEVEPKHPMENVLYAIDELTGLVTAAVLVRPSKNIADLTVKSLKKKWKDKAFAAGADRNVIQEGANRMGVELSDLFADVIAGMQDAASDLGLDGSLALESTPSPMDPMQDRSQPQDQEG